MFFVCNTYTVYVCSKRQFNNGGEVREVAALEETDLLSAFATKLFDCSLQKGYYSFTPPPYTTNSLKVSWSEANHRLNTFKNQDLGFSLLSFQF